MNLHSDKEAFKEIIALAAERQRVRCGVLVFLYLPFHFLKQSGEVCFQRYLMFHNLVLIFYEAQSYGHKKSVLFLIFHITFL